MATFTNIAKTAATFTNIAKSLVYFKLLMESGSNLLLETGDKILLETTGTPVYTNIIKN